MTGIKFTSMPLMADWGQRPLSRQNKTTGNQVCISLIVRHPVIYPGLYIPGHICYLIIRKSLYRSHDEGVVIIRLSLPIS